MKKEDFHINVEKTLNSLDGIQRAEANPFLLTRILEQMQKVTVEVVKPSLIWQAIASFILVIGLNIAIGSYALKENPRTTVSSGSEYFSNNQYNY